MRFSVAATFGASSSLAGIQAALETAENAGGRFSSLHVTTLNDANRTNQTVLSCLLAGGIPAANKLTELVKDPPSPVATTTPEGKTLVWLGEALLEGELSRVAAYRRE